MEQLEISATAVGLLAAGTAMILYENLRAKAGKPIFGGREVITLYYVSYLMLIALGLAFGASALIR
jgi:hypothetical protein